MSGAATTIAVASALALVLQFAMLRAPRRTAALNLLRLHVAAGALAAGAAAWSASARPVEAGVLLAGAVLLAGTALRVRGMLRRLDARTSGSQGGAAGSIWAMPSIAAGLALTALAVLSISALDASAAAVQRQGMAFALACVLLGLLSASRPGPPAPMLARLVAVGDALVLLGCAARAEVATMAACLLLTPSVLAVAAATLGRAGGLPALDEDGWR